MSIKGLFPLHKWDFESGRVLADLPEQDLALLMSRKTESAYKKGQVIFREGGYPSGLYYVVNGRVKKYKSDHDGGEQIIYVAGTGELLGFHAILSGDNYPDSAAVLSHEFVVLVNSLTMASRRPVRERLALQLIVVREKYKSETNNSPVEINLSRDDLASLVGTARENVVRILSEFKEEGILSTRGRKIIVRDIKRLIEVANYK
ncbi:MAG TPA: Crp/Fnr family transcriptional regulator [Puia sp.]|nr:Crp/Fnr family transcriptional regulator [Puia sp.]